MKSSLVGTLAALSGGRIPELIASAANPKRFDSVRHLCRLGLSIV
ncbi:MAG TPA: hypothetical protein VL068_07315 [Microthrixaceae bacterium]|nr:hypothetical protein [Microthrixaceae bacterium]